MTRRSLRHSALALLALLCIARPARAADPTMFAAASTAAALEEIAEGYRAARSVRIRLSFGASITLARQIESGAPADLFLSADTATMDYLAARGLIDPASRADLLSNRLVVVIPADRPAPAKDATLADILGGILAAGRLALPDPALAPAGQYARAALERLGLWARVEPRLALASDVRAAALWVERGEAEGGIVYATDARTPRLRIAAGLPREAHPPIRYPVAAMKNASDEAYNFLGYLRGPGRAIFAKHGFVVD